METNIKRKLIKLSKHMIYVVVIIILFLFIGYWAFALLIPYQLFKIWKAKGTTKKQKVIKSLITIGRTAIFISLFKLFGLMGAGGFVLMIVLFSAWKIYTGRGIFMEGVRDIETRLWGRPLDKKQWTKEEWKGRKMKSIKVFK